MTIALDLDEVVFNYIDPFLKFVNKKFGTNWSRPDVTSYSFEECGILPPGTNGQYIAEFADAGNLLNLPLMEGAAEVIKKLLRYGHEIFYVTSRDEKYAKDTIEALQKAGIELHIRFSTRAATKAQIIVETCSDVFVDDSPRFINEVLSDTSARGILFSNIEDSIKKCPRVAHAHKWADLYSLIT